jgi:hypothetical protein
MVFKKAFGRRPNGLAVRRMNDSGRQKLAYVLDVPCLPK